MERINAAEFLGILLLTWLDILLPILFEEVIDIICLLKSYFFYAIQLFA